MSVKKRLAFSTLGCPGWGFPQILTNAAEMGFSAIEIRGIGAQMQTDQLDCFAPQNREATKKLLKDAQIEICGIGTSSTFHLAESVPSALTEGFKAIDVCNAMQIGAIRVFGDAFPEGENRDSVVRRAADGINTLCSYAESTGFVKVLLEIHGQFNTVEALSSLLPLISGRPSFGILWDIEHSFRAYGKDFRAFYHLIRPYIRHLHVKDCRMENGEPVILELGKGDVNVAEIVRELEKDGYKGFYSFEWEKRWHPEIPEPEIAFPGYAAYMNRLFDETNN